MATLVLLRHGESEWNARDRFTGWVDVGLTARGEREARRSGALLRATGLRPTVVHTSALTRAIRTATLAADAAGATDAPVTAHWRLNERCYGSLQGRPPTHVLAAHGETAVRSPRR